MKVSMRFIKSCKFSLVNQGKHVKSPSSFKQGFTELILHILSLTRTDAGAFNTGVEQSIAIGYLTNCFAHLQDTIIIN